MTERLQKIESDLEVTQEATMNQHDGSNQDQENIDTNENSKIPFIFPDSKGLLDILAPPEEPRPSAPPRLHPEPEQFPKTPPAIKEPDHPLVSILKRNNAPPNVLKALFSVLDRLSNAESVGKYFTFGSFERGLTAYTANLDELMALLPGTGYGIDYEVIDGVRRPILTQKNPKRVSAFDPSTKPVSTDKEPKPTIGSTMGAVMEIFANGETGLFIRERLLGTAPLSSNMIELLKIYLNSTTTVNLPVLRNRYKSLGYSDFDETFTRLNEIISDAWKAHLISDLQSKELPGIVRLRPYKPEQS